MDWGYQVLGVGLLLLILAVAVWVLKRIEVRTVNGSFWQAIVKEGERQASLAVMATEKYAAVLVSQGKAALAGADKKAIADGIYDNLPDTFKVDGVVVPVWQFKRWVSRGQWEAAVQKAFDEAVGLIDRVQLPGAPKG